MVDGEMRAGTATGDGPVDAIFNAIRSFSRTRPSLQLSRSAR